MLAATNFDNLLVLLFFAAAIVFQILTKAVSKGRRRPPETRGRSPSQTTRRLEREEDATDEQQIRKFLEALGQPTTSKPPPPARPRPSYQRPDVLPPVGAPFGSPLPPLKTRPPDLPREIRLPQQIPPTREAKPFRPTTAETPFEVHRGPAPLEPAPVIKTPAEAYEIATKPVSKPTAARIDLATMLRSTSGLRDAIILREIFGPPRSMQPIDLVGSV